MQVSAYARYGAHAASTRQRMLQFLPGLRDAGIDVKWSGLLDDDGEPVRAGVEAGLVTLRGRHRVTGLVVDAGAVAGVRGVVLVDDEVARGAPSSREEVAEFELRAPAVVVTSGGIGADHDLVRKFWPERLGPPPREMVTGVPSYVDGSMLETSRSTRGRKVYAAKASVLARIVRSPSAAPSM